jgi:hypothetical protein
MYISHWRPEQGLQLSLSFLLMRATELGLKSEMARRPWTTTGFSYFSRTPPAGHGNSPENWETKHTRRMSSTRSSMVKSGV